MQRVRVWDLSVRILHWLLTASFLGAAGIAFLTDDDGPWFRIHMLLGLMAGLVVVLRLLWGFIGTKYALFGSFLFGPKALVEYLRGAFRRAPEKRHVGHNPGSSYAIWAMLLLPLALAGTGLLMSRGIEAAEEVHEPLALVALAAVGAHLVGLVWYTVRNKENVALGMIDGRKLAEASDEIPTARPAAAALMLAVCAAWGATLALGYDAEAGVLRLPLVGQTITLGEGEEEEEQEREREHGRVEREDEDRAREDGDHEREDGDHGRRRGGHDRDDD